jgi:hypothetical protein
MPTTILSHVSGMKDATPVPTRAAGDLPEQVFFDEFVSKSSPLLIKGAVRHWPAGRNWRDPSYLKSLCGHRQVMFFPHENHITGRRMMAGRRDMTFGEALDLLNLDRTAIASLGLPEDFPEMRRDLGGFSFLTRAEPPFIYPPVRYFIYRNAGSTWHYHPFDETLMCQFVGSKKVGLLNARTPLQKRVQEIFFAEDYYEDPHKAAGLAGADIPFFAATVDEGDALYIPPLWWHGVTASGAGFGITAAIPWRSPLGVVTDGIRRMAAGEVDLMGATSEEQLQSLISVADKLGLARELKIAFERAWVMPVPL